MRHILLTSPFPRGRARSGYFLVVKKRNPYAPHHLDITVPSRPSEQWLLPSGEEASPYVPYHLDITITSRPSARAAERQRRPSGPSRLVWRGRRGAAEASVGRSERPTERESERPTERESESDRTRGRGSGAKKQSEAERSTSSGAKSDAECDATAKKKPPPPPHTHERRERAPSSGFHSANNQPASLPSRHATPSGHAARRATRARRRASSSLSLT